MKIKKYIPFIIIAVILLVLSLAVYKFGSVAMVNGRPISRLAYIREMEKKVGKQVVEQMVQEEMIWQEAKKNNINIEQTKIDEELKKIEENIKGQGLTLDSALESEGLTKEDLKKQIQLQMIVEQLAGKGNEVTQEQISQFLIDYKSQLPTGSSKEELQTIAKQELESQAKNQAINEWFEKLTQSYKVDY